MDCLRGMCVSVCVSIAFLLVLCSQAAAFNPQPEPPASPYNWSVEGFMDMWATAVAPTGSVTPFGIDPGIVGNAAMDFSAEVIARFTAPTTTAGEAADGLYDVAVQHFLLQIGDTTWDDTMPGTMQFEVIGGVVTGVLGTVTLTMPAHPDLLLALPASPGTWEALDKRGNVDLGTVTGTYALRDGVVPEPMTACLLVLGGLAVIRRRAQVVRRPVRRTLGEGG